MYEHNGFHQTFFTVTEVEKVIKVPYHSDVELNHGTLCNTLSSLTCNMEPGVDHALCCSYTIVCSSCLQNLLKLPVIPAIWRTCHYAKTKNMWIFKDPTPILSKVSACADIHGYADLFPDNQCLAVNDIWWIISLVGVWSHLIKKLETNFIYFAQGKEFRCHLSDRILFLMLAYTSYFSFTSTWHLFWNISILDYISTI